MDALHVKISALERIIEHLEAQLAKEPDNA